MKLQINKITLIIVGVGILTFSSAFGAKTASNGESPKGALEESLQVPKFSKVKVIDSLKDYGVEIYLNEKSPNEKEMREEVESLHVRMQTLGLAVPVAASDSVSRFRLVLKDKNGKRTSSERKRVVWINNDKAEEFTNILGRKLKGINVTLERDPTDKDTLVIDVKKVGESENKNPTVVTVENAENN